MENIIIGEIPVSGFCIYYCDDETNNIFKWLIIIKTPKILCSLKKYLFWLSTIEEHVYIELYIHILA